MGMEKCEEVTQAQLEPAMKQTELVDTSRAALPPPFREHRKVSVDFILRVCTSYLVHKREIPRTPIIVLVSSALSCGGQSVVTKQPVATRNRPAAEC